MNHHPSWSRQDDHEALRHLVAVPLERDLPGGRHPELREFLMQEIQQPPTRSTTRSRAFTWRRMSLATATVAIGAAVAFAAPAILGVEEKAEAFTVTNLDDGKVKVEIHELKDPDGLERRLEEEGISAEVDYLPDGKYCQPDRYEPVPDHVLEMSMDHKSMDWFATDREPDATLVIASGWDEQQLDSPDGSVRVRWLDVHWTKGPVEACEPQDGRR